MSGESIVSVLLPASKVDIFALDDNTASTAEKLVSDWRFARVGIGIHRAGMAEAVQKYGQTASPELIIIETNDIGETFLQQLGQLAGVCTAGTDAVIIGPTNDVHLYRNLVGMGVRDYLVRPVSEEDFITVIAKVLIDKRGLTGSRLTVVAGAKGGVGTTAITQMLAYDIAENLKQKTLLMDMAGSFGSMGIRFGVEPSATMAEVVRIGSSGSEDDLKRVIQPVGEHLSLMVSGGDALLAARPDADSIENSVDRLLQKYPVVVLDLSGASRLVQKRMMARANEVVLVTTALLPSLRNARAFLTEIKTFRSSLKEVDVVLNMSGFSASDEVPEKDMKAALGTEVAARIDFLPKVFVSGEASGKMAGLGKPLQDVLHALRPVSLRAAGVSDVSPEAASSAGKKESPLDALKKMLKK